MRSLIAQVIFALVTAVVVVAIFSLRPFDRKQRWIEKIVHWWGQCIFTLTGVGLINHCDFPEGQPYIVMANHESYLDPPLLIWQVPFPLRFIAKKDLFYIPILGFGMWLMGHIFIDRQNHSRAISSLKQAAEKIKKGRSVLVFPEGTRSQQKDTELLPFKKGGFMLAIESQVPILPIGIAGTGQCLAKGTWLIRHGNVCYHVGCPISTQGLSADDRDRLMQEVRSNIEALREHAHQILSERVSNKRRPTQNGLAQCDKI